MAGSSQLSCPVLRISWNEKLVCDAQEGIYPDNYGLSLAWHGMADFDFEPDLLIIHSFCLL